MPRGGGRRGLSSPLAVAVAAKGSILSRCPCRTEHSQPGHLVCSTSPSSAPPAHSQVLQYPFLASVCIYGLFLGVPVGSDTRHAHLFSCSFPPLPPLPNQSPFQTNAHTCLPLVGETGKQTPKLQPPIHLSKVNFTAAILACLPELRTSLASWDRREGSACRDLGQSGWLQWTREGGREAEVEA